MKLKYQLNENYNFGRGFVKEDSNTEGVIKVLISRSDQHLLYNKMNKIFQSLGFEYKFEEDDWKNDYAYFWFPYESESQCDQIVNKIESSLGRDIKYDLDY